MPLGDGIRRNIAYVDPSERALLRDAFIELNKRFFPGSRTDTPVGGVSWWFKQDEIHQATHVHGGPEFLPWHREIVNRLEAMLRQINPQLSLHYWDWMQDPRNIPNSNLGGGLTGNLNLFTSEFMGYGGISSASIGEPWLSAGYYVSGASPHRDSSGNPADPPQNVSRNINGTPASDDNSIINAPGYSQMRTLLESVHNDMHGFVNMGGAHISFRDPFVFLLHSNVDRLFALWQTKDPTNRLNPVSLYGNESDLLDVNVEPWSGGLSTRPWTSPENQQFPHSYKHPSIVAPPCYDTNLTNFQVSEVENPLNTATSRYQIIFNDVPEEETTWRAAAIKVYTCSAVTFKVKPGTEPSAPFSIVTPSVVKQHGAYSFLEIRLWFEFTAGALGTAPQAIPAVNTTIQCVENGQEFQFELKANTIRRPTVAVQLSLDQSGSMAWDAGTSGVSRLQVLKDSANLFARLIQKNNGIGIVRFDHDAYPPNDPTYGGMPITKIATDSFGDAARIHAISVINAHGAYGNTSVGDGLEMARTQLNALVPGNYDLKAIIVLTDGLENTPKFISDVSSSIDNLTYAVGLGNESQVNTIALTALSGSTGGYLLLTGLLSANLDDEFRLRKFFLQILAGVTNTSIVKDPVGYINAGSKIKIPFKLSEADINCRAILLTDFPVVDLFIETPDGKIITEGNASSFGVTFDTANNIKTAKFNLPLALEDSKSQSGIWYVILEVNENLYKKIISKGEDPKHKIIQNPLIGLRTKGAKYCVSIHSFSNLRMTAIINQTGFIPGSSLSLRVSLREYNLPVEKRAKIIAELEFPDKTNSILHFSELTPGTFESSFIANLVGIYRFRVLAEGVTYRGIPFTREQLLTAGIFHEVKPPFDQTRNGDDWKHVVDAIEKCCKKILSSKSKR